MASNRPPRWYFSLRSPYSWLAYRELTDRYPDLLATLEWRPFWEPDEGGLSQLTGRGGAFPYVDMGRAKSRYILQDVRRLAAARGLTPTWPVDRAPVWEVPHLAYLAAEDAGRGRAFVDAAYDARWQRGLDICDRSVVGALGERLGLPAELLAAAADDPELRRRGTDCLLAAEADGVFGVPFFAAGYEKFWGVDRVHQFAAAVAARPAAAADPTGPEAALVPSADAGHAGGCG